jgi:hypothetical protein
MRLQFAICVATALLTPTAGHAQGDINLAAELPGKTCLGWFAIPNPKGNTNDQGAVRITFANGTATIETSFGMASYRAPNEAKFAAPDPVVALQVTANEAALTRKGSDWKLVAFRREGPAIVVRGQADPRRAQPTWVVANTQLSCQ